MSDESLTHKQRALAELELRRRETIKKLGPVYDWYGKPCMCSDYNPETKTCRKHPRALEHQRPPLGEWLTWLLMAGRSAGKTRSAAEWLREKVESHAARNETIRIALVNETVSEVRRVQIEGASGLLAVSPPWFMPVYIPSKAEVVWPNGSVAYIYSGEQPDQLRGPQHHYAWCLAGWTSVLMGDCTEKPISQINVGDMVATRHGPKAVIASELTRRDAEVYRLSTETGQSIVGTGDHPVWIEGKGFIPISGICDGDLVSVVIGIEDTSHGPIPVLDQAKVTSAQKLTTLSCVYDIEVEGESEFFADGILVHNCDELCFEAGTLVSCHDGDKPIESIKPGDIVWTRNGLRPVKRSWMSSSSAEVYRLTASDGRSIVGTGNHPIWVEGEGWTAIKNVRPGGLLKSMEFSRELSGEVTAGGSTDHITCQGMGNCFISPSETSSNSSEQNSPHADSSADLHCEGSDGLRSVSVERLPERVPVYNLEVDETPEYFANGILAHNCKWSKAQAAVWDNLLLGMRLGDNPQIVVSTTPQPTPTLRAIIADKFTVMSRASTYANRHNLPEKFFQSVVSKYEGTRIGRQELHAEVLLQNQNALWNQEQLDSLRVRAVPYGVDIKKVVVGVDPAGKIGDMAKFVHGMPTEAGKGDEAGIVVAGLGTDGHGYILGDHSTSGSPDAWGRAVAEAYGRHQANTVVWESNHGGDMVRDVLLAVNPNIVQKRVHASRSKYVRAEPIGALAEQGKIHIVGELPKLESEMCDFEPGGPSPNRMDAMVFALTDLMIQPDEEKVELEFRRTSFKGLF